MNLRARLAIGWLVLGAMLSTSGCNNHYLSNRYYDFRDTLTMAAGVTAENPVTGIIPPSFGAHVQVSDWLQLGWITHNGLTAETDLRGTFVGPESYTQAGFLWWQMLRKNQNYDEARYYSAFKDKDFAWCTRMESYLLSAHGRPAKRLHYEYWAPYSHQGSGLLHQGWQYWGNSGAQVAISDPFLTHLGLMLKLGFDISEVSDFLLGWFTVDYKHDDMTAEEFDIFRDMKGQPRGSRAESDVVLDSIPAPQTRTLASAD